MYPLRQSHAPTPFLNSHTAHFKKAALNTPVHLLKTWLFESPVSNSLHRLNLRERYKQV